MFYKIQQENCRYFLVYRFSWQFNADSYKIFDIIAYIWHNTISFHNVNILQIFEKHKERKNIYSAKMSTFTVSLGFVFPANLTYTFTQAGEPGSENCYIKGKTDTHLPWVMSHYVKNTSEKIHRQLLIKVIETLEKSSNQ